MRILEKIPSSMMGVTIMMATLSPVVMIAASSRPGLMKQWIVIYIMVGVVASLGAMLFDRAKRNKAKDFSKGVEQNAGSAEGVKDPNKIAQIDHMRKEFQKGIDIYKKYGKDLYSLPWYVVVGEAGSGKTEAVRRSEIGFPDKLQDKWQGSGGTLSMHWWFTNKAVILDTAGRLFVQDGSAGDGAQNQWVSFLQMLKKNRPDCPINGLVLVIPATRLLAHEDPDAEATSLGRLDQNAGQISRQLEVLQSELGIRFPVYIMVTKTDKLPGFREYFEGIDTADGRYQMLGWSNPASLGEAFNPQSVTDYMRSVADRLKRRMMSALRNPEPAVMSGLRIDEVDALFSFPSTFASMAPKLQRYLRQVFTSDEWSAKPPYLRGIYFSSALQQGRVLDEAVANALGIPLEQMDTAEEEDGLRLSKNRTYFMRDLFLEKIFREKGLVTRADKVKSSISGWRLWLPASFAVFVMVLALIGWRTAKGGEEARMWTTLWDSERGEGDRRIAPLIVVGSDSVSWGSPEVFRALEVLGTDVQSRPRFGWIFAPAQLFDKSLSRERRELYGSVVAEGFAETAAMVAARLEEAADRPSGLRQTEWEALEALLILHHAGVDSVGKLVFPVPVKGDTEVTLRDLIMDLTKFMELGEEERKNQIVGILERAAEMKDADFNGKLKIALDPGLVRRVMEKAFPEEGAQQTDDFVREFDQYSETYAGSLEKIRKAAPEAASRAKELRSGAEALLSKYPGEIAASGSGAAPVHGAGASDGRTLVTDLVKRHAPLQAIYPHLAPRRKASLSTMSMKMIKDDARFLKGVVTALSPDGGDGFSVEEAEALLKSVSEAPPEEDENAGDLATMRSWWLANEFYPKQFFKYLRFPLVKDGETGSEEDLYLLLNLVQVLEAVGQEDSNFSNLSKFANAVFDPAKFRRDVFSSVRSVKITAEADDNSYHAGVWNGDDKLAEIITRISPVESFEARLNMALVFKKVLPPPSPPATFEQGPAWSALRWKSAPGGQGWIKTVTHPEGWRLKLKFEMPDDLEIPEAEDWPELENFANPS